MKVIKDISVEEAKECGIESRNTIFEHGEKRFRQVCIKDKTAYIRCEGGKKGYWQNSHYHKTLKELHIVQKGKLLIANYIDGKVSIVRVNENEVYQLEPNVPHNVYMYPNTIVHTVKYGKIDEYDWTPCEELDEILLKKPIQEWEQE